MESSKIMISRFIFSVEGGFIKSKKDCNNAAFNNFGWGGRIRTLGMAESESAALPLGDTPIKCVLI